jgi:hypothetical protein
MARVPGRWRSLSVNRRMIAELMATCRTMPIITIERRMALADLVTARNGLPDPPSWVALFAKAFALVAAKRPELRRAYMPHPWPHFYETEGSVASIAVEREFGGESAVFFGQFFQPEGQTLDQLQNALVQWRDAPVEEVRDFRRVLNFMRVPRPLRRLAWWYALKVAGRHRVRQFGTFGISTTASAGATCRNLIAPVPYTINYGLLAPDGTLDVRLHFDHRVVDGMPAARALAELEDELRTTILAELRALAAPAIRTGVRAVGIVVAGGDR